MRESESSNWTDEETDPPTTPANQPGGLRRAGRFTVKLVLILGTVFFLFLLGLSLISSLSLEGLQSVQQHLARVDAPLMWLRLLLIGTLIGFWQPINAWLAQRNAWSQARLERVMKGRWMTLAVLLFVELVLIQRLHEPLIDGMVH